MRSARHRIKLTKFARDSCRIFEETRLLLVVWGASGREEAEALSILHSRSILDRLDVLFVVESDRLGVEAEEVTNAVAHVVPHALTAPILEPDLDEALLRAQAEAGSEHVRLLELLADERKEHALPHAVYVILFFDFADPNASLWALFPHWHLAVAEEKQVNLARQLAGPLKVNVVVEKVLDRWDASERTQLIAVRHILARLHLLGRLLLVSLVLAGSHDSLGSLIKPELPHTVQGVRLAQCWRYANHTGLRKSFAVGGDAEDIELAWLHERCLTG